MPKLFILVNEDRFFLSHRKPVAMAAQKAGYEVVVVAKNLGHRKNIEDLGFKMIELPIDPTGMNPFHELKTLWFVFNLYRKQRPDIVHHVGLKGILWGGLASKILKINGVVNAVCGLGGLFSKGESSMTTKSILKIFKMCSNRKNTKFIFQNKDDERIFLNYKVVKPYQIEFTHGSGIDLNEYSFVEETEDDIVKVIFTARMVKEKGVCDLIEAAERLKPEYKNKVKFILCGRLTPNKTGISEEYMHEHCDGDYISWLGERDDVKRLLQGSHIMAFPSYYREGLPKSLIEAAAIGRPIITCNSVGCRDVVEDGVNGLLVEPKNPTQLVQALKTLIDCPELRRKMGKEARKKAERDFSIEKVIDTHLKIYKSLSQF